MACANHDSMAWLMNAEQEELRGVVRMLYDVHRLIAAITDVDILLERIMEESKHTAQAEACSLMLYDAGQDELYFSVALGESGDQQVLKRQVRLKLGQGIAGVAAATRQPVNVNDVRQDTRFFNEADKLSHFETRSVLAIPMLDHDRLVGVLELINKLDGGPFTEMDLRVMQMFAGLVATVLSNARLIAENLRSERLAAIGEAVAGLSHFAKNIIAGMSGSVDLIDQAMQADDLETIHRCWPTLRRSNIRLMNLVEDMLAFSKARAPVRIETDVAEVMQETVQTFHALLARRNIVLQMDTSGLVGPVMLDARGLLRCLLNLLSNAADAVPEGSGQIWLWARSFPDVVEVCVADNGPGVPTEHIHKICEPFFSTKGSQGTGLGLAVTKKIANEHGGRLVIGQRDGGGALFKLIFPVDADNVEEQVKRG